MTFQSVSERQRAKSTIIVKLQPSRSTVSIFALLNSEVARPTAPIFIKFSHDVEALVQLLIRAFTKRCCIFFGNARAKGEDDQF